MSDRLKQWLAGVPIGVREQTIQQYTGSTLPYILKRLYICPPDQLPTFKLRIALGLDKASNGQLDFRTMIDGTDEIDWDYLKRRLSRKKSLTESESAG
jgi:hypothetical protein